jgi:hypothetical protein
MAQYIFFTINTSNMICTISARCFSSGNESAFPANAWQQHLLLLLQLAGGLSAALTTFQHSHS